MSKLYRNEQGQLVIERDGLVLVSPGRGPTGLPLWPLEELFSRRKFKPTVEARIRRLNPSGYFEEGTRIRGMFYEPISWRRYKKHLYNRPTLYYRMRGGKPTSW